MATFDFNRMSVPVNTDNIVAEFINYGPLKGLTVKDNDANGFVLDAPGPLLIQYIGEDLKYKQNGDPTKGTITDIKTFYAGKPNFTFDINGLDIDIPEMKAAFASKDNPLDDLAFLADIFSGNDTFIGGKVDDKFYGLGGKDTMDGNDGNDTLEGGDGKDVLNGDRGNDVLSGGAGKDSFIFDRNVKGLNNVDTITDFNSAEGDKIKLDDNIFRKIGGPGALDSAYFHNGAVGGANTDGGIIYDSATGDLWWDRKGLDAIKFAHLDNAPALAASDFVIV
jgi:Ca2+-binding RTX toxin-like protein